jgi:hypothetical protein
MVAGRKTVIFPDATRQRIFQLWKQRRLPSMTALAPLLPLPAGRCSFSLWSMGLADVLLNRGHCEFTRELESDINLPRDCTLSLNRETCVRLAQLKSKRL